MIVMIVDDENLTLKMMTKTVQQVLPEAEIHPFLRAREALAFAENHLIGIVFLDIQMRGMKGTEFAEKLKTIQPHINIIFCTAYDNYKSDAMDLRASGYLMKPIQAEEIQNELKFLRFPLEEGVSIEQKLTIHCFGDFLATFQGNPLPFSYQKTNELLAILVDRNGAMCSYSMLEEILWESIGLHISYLKRLRKDLIETLKTLHLEHIIVTRRGMLGLKTEAVVCDYFDFLSGNSQATASYQGIYMAQYSWAEETNSMLWWRKQENVGILPEEQ